MPILLFTLLFLLGAMVVLSFVPWLALGLTAGLAAHDQTFFHRRFVRPLWILSVTVATAFFLLGWWFPPLALALMALLFALSAVTMLWILTGWIRDRNLLALDPLLRQCGIRRTWLAASLAAQIVLGFSIWFAFIRNASQSTYDEIARVCQAIPGVKSVDVIGSTNDNMFNDHGFSIELTLNNGGKLGLAGPLWPEDLDFHERRAIELYQIGNYTFEGAEVRAGFGPERALTRFRVVSVGNFTNGVLPFAVSSLPDLVAHYAQMESVVAKWPVAPAVNRLTFQGPNGAEDYYYALHPSDVPSTVDVPLSSSAL